MEQSTATPGRALTSEHGGVLQCLVVTPEATVVEASANFIVVPLFDGELGIAPGHSAMIGRLGFGEMRLTSPEDKTTAYYIDGGFVQVVDNVVSILTHRSLPAEKIDPQVASEALSAAHKRPITTPELQQIRDRLESQARAQLSVARRSRRAK
ncbi:MAG: ATP synthase F1 subunit epsilon [Planctomycetes bacterium]|nr:ATP synthase F1 subunit epsilon [Planctomycetota bacterium]